MGLLSGCAHCPGPAKNSTAQAPTPTGTEKPATPLVIKEFAPESVNANVDAPYLLVVSIDGFRYDYAEKYGAKNILEVAANGAAAESLVPIYPSKTFPNHYSIATGLYADEHGIVSNNFYDPDLNADYRLGGPMITESKWYLGEPIWVTTEKNGMRSAVCFWVGSEAPVQNKLPNYYGVYSDAVPNDKRVEKVAEWLNLPVDKRPHFLMVYFSTVDSAGHKFGPDSDEVAAAVRSIDQTIGELRAKIAATKLPVNLIIVSDHGMEKLDLEKVIELKGKVDLDSFRVADSRVSLVLHLRPGQPRSAIAKAKREINKLKLPVRAWQPKEMAKLHYTKSKRLGDLILEPEHPYVVGYGDIKPGVLPVANHGWDPSKAPLMHGIFYAEGPAFKKGVKIKSFANVNLFPLMAKVLDLNRVPKVSGSLAPFKGVLTLSK